MRGSAILEQPFIGWHRPISHGALDHPSETITNPGRFQPSRRQEPVEAPNGLSAGRIDLSFAFLCAGVHSENHVSSRRRRLDLFVHDKQLVTRIG